MLQTERTIELQGFWGALQTVDEAVLVVEYDRVIEPYRLASTESMPPVSVLGLLDSILVTCRTHVVIISDREASDLLRVFHTLPRPEIWGSGGLERLLSNGRYEVAPMDRDLLETFVEANSWLDTEGLRHLATLKPNGIKISWQKLSDQEASEARTRAKRVLAHFKHRPGLAIYDGHAGCELRFRKDSTSRVLNTFLRELPAKAVVAYLGSSKTNPQSHMAMKDRGLSLLVSDSWMDSEADVWLHAPDELVRFLADWVRTCGGEL